MDKQKQIEYYVLKNKETGMYFRGKGVNRWGKYFNQATIYRVKGTAEASVREVSWHGEQAEVVPIYIEEVPKNAVLTGDDIAELLTIVAKDTRKETAEKFAERLKEMAYQSTDWSHGVHPMVVEVDYIDEICKELVEGEK